MKIFTQKIIVVLLLGVSFGAWAFIPDNPPPNPDAYGRQLCSMTGFYCLTVKPDQTWKGILPNHRERDIMMRLNRSNVQLKYRTFIVVPDNLAHADVMSVSPFPLAIFPPKHKLIVVNLSLQAYAAYNPKGKMVFWGPATGGQAWCADINKPCTTPIGSFRIFKKEGADCVSNSFPVGQGGSPMPYCMYFHGGAALHGAEVPGIPSTHGCVGMYNNDARWLNENFITAADVVGQGTIVKVFA